MNKKHFNVLKNIFSDKNFYHHNIFLDKTFYQKKRGQWFAPYKAITTTLFFILA